MREHATGWPRVRLADTGRWLSGGTPFTGFPQYWNGHIPWISAASLKNFDIVDSERSITELGALSGTRLVPKSTVLFVVRGMSLKSEFRVGITQRQVAFGQDCKAIIADPGIDPRFLAYSLDANTDRILRMVDEAGHGTGRLPTDQLAKLSISVPPMTEQRRIVEILDSSAQSIRSSSRRLDKLNRLRDALVVSGFRALDGRRQLAEFISSGPQNGLYKPAGDYTDSGRPIVRIDSFSNGTLRPVDDLKRVRILPTEARIYGLSVDDILINRVNTIDLVGKSVLVTNLKEVTVFESNIMRMKLESGRVRPRYAALWLSSSEAMSHFHRCAKSAIGQASINQGDIRACPIPIPSVAEQEAIIATDDGAAAKINVVTDELAKLRKLKQGLMNDLLTGRVRVKDVEGVAG